MKLLVAETAGFCWGVRRALDQAVDLTKKTDGPVYTYGPLIHNTQVLEQLKSQNVHTLDGIEQVQSGTILVRAHGVRPEVIDELNTRSDNVFDATCPLVRRVQKALSTYVAKGYDTVIVGDADHAEVVGLRGYTEDKCYVVADESEVDGLPSFDRVCVVSQTTRDDRTFERVVERIRAKADEVRAINTICEPTRDHQTETIELAHRADLMVVVGGRHSANTVRLVKLAQDEGARVVHVETDGELRPEMFTGCDTVAVTAGASTPEWMINRVVTKIRSYSPEARSTLRTWLANLASLIVASNAYVAAGAAALTLACVKLLDPYATAPQGLPVIAVAAFFILAMHAVNRYLERSAYSGWGTFSPRAYERFQKVMMLGGIGALAIVLALSAWVGPLPFIMVLFSGAFGVLYTVKIIPLRWARHLYGVRRIKDLPASRDFSVAFGWTLVTAVLPVLVLHASVLRATAVSLFAFLLVFVRAALLGVRDVQGDKIMGMETTFKVVGRRRTKEVLIGFVAALIVVLAALAVTSSGALALSLLPVVLYVCTVGWLYERRLLPKGPEGELVVDGQFLLAGIMTLVWRALLV
ncbi:MAG TPA: 4-hydroxy-3-methylbut-2-enyl diphosphate reductase [Candidatus Acidoferrales bacterium]|nr:4-hydroxy-3-methylbut-2-enyl diphosphate reductase [Candidatus Acidoferrales bacterium]